MILVENCPVPFDVRVWRESRALTEAGYQVSVICPMGKGYDTGWHELREGVHIYRYPMLEAKAGLLSYLLEYGQALVCMGVYSLYVLLRRGFDVIQLCNPPDLLIFVAAPFKLLGKKVITLAALSGVAKPGEEPKLHRTERAAESPAAVPLVAQ